MNDCFIVLCLSNGRYSFFEKVRECNLQFMSMYLFVLVFVVKF